MLNKLQEVYSQSVPPDWGESTLGIFLSAVSRTPHPVPRTSSDSASVSGFITVVHSLCVWGPLLWSGRSNRFPILPCTSCGSRSTGHKWGWGDVSWESTDFGVSCPSVELCVWLLNAVLCFWGLKLSACRRVHSCGALASKFFSGSWQSEVSPALEHSASDLCVSCVVQTQALLETALPGLGPAGEVLHGTYLYGHARRVLILRAPDTHPAFCGRAGLWQESTRSGCCCHGIFHVHAPHFSLLLQISYLCFWILS